MLNNTIQTEKISNKELNKRKRIIQRAEELGINLTKIDDNKE